MTTTSPLAISIVQILATNTTTVNYDLYTNCSIAMTLPSLMKDPHLQMETIKGAAIKYFRWVMPSHRWDNSSRPVTFERQADLPSGHGPCTTTKKNTPAHLTVGWFSDPHHGTLPNPNQVSQVTTDPQNTHRPIYIDSVPHVNPDDQYTNQQHVADPQGITHPQSTYVSTYDDSIPHAKPHNQYINQPPCIDPSTSHSQTMHHSIYVDSGLHNVLNSQDEHTNQPPYIDPGTSHPQNMYDSVYVDLGDHINHHKQYTNQSYDVGLQGLPHSQNTHPSTYIDSVPHINPDDQSTNQRNDADLQATLYPRSTHVLTYNDSIPYAKPHDQHVNQLTCIDSDVSRPQTMHHSKYVDSGFHASNSQDQYTNQSCDIGLQGPPHSQNTHHSTYIDSVPHGISHPQSILNHYHHVGDAYYHTPRPEMSYERPDPLVQSSDWMHSLFDVHNAGNRVEGEHPRGVLSDLDECIELHRDALLLCPPGHSDRSQSLDNLAISLGGRFLQQGVPSDLDESFNLFSQLPHTSHAVSCEDLAAAKSWITAAEETNHASALLAYHTALKFLDQNVTLLSSSSRNFDVIRMATVSLAVDAFSCSIRHCALITAVELVEQGRAVFWTQLARLSSPFDELSLPSDTGAVLVEEFKQLSSRLRAVFDWSTKDQSSQIRQVTIQWNDVLSRIHMLLDFSRFLLPPLFSNLQKATNEGPVIIVNASQYSCNALIVLRDQDPVHIPIDITQTYVSELSTKFQSVAEQFGCSDQQNKLVGILHKLWHHIVKPVVQALRVLNVCPGSHIWWCPTAEFTLLPLHAAGPQYFVAIGQGNPDRGKELRCIAPELASIAQCLSPIVSSFTSFQDSDAMVQVVLDALNHNQWLHLACHGMPNRQRPFKSSFVMRDGPLMIKDIIRLNWQNPEFAFLSACHTTVGDENSPDESIHLAVAMQFSGFHSVIGSMWSVDDDVARQVVSTVYDKLVDDSGRLDCRQAAVALHKAVKKLQCNNVPLEQQIVFVHIGV
ncbi:CHAT domain-containing protein [Suillus cothurnatus]|nr:CHAT domain-containing protein [Suillus cothurnatus]